MAPWTCGIDGCGTYFEAIEDLIVHQTSDHAKSECAVCGTVVPEGYFAIRHAFEEHTRAEYVRSYDASSDHVRHREQIKDAIEERANLESVFERLEETGDL